MSTCQVFLVQAEDAGGLEADVLRDGQLKEVLPQSPVPPLLLLPNPVTNRDW